jgi:hypothetical protein
MNRRDTTHCVVLRCPDHAEIQYLDRVPTRGTRLRDSLDQEWVVEEVLQSGRDAYTVWCVARPEYHASERGDVAGELLELARRSVDRVAERRRKWKHRNDYF